MDAKSFIGVIAVGRKYGAVTFYRLPRTQFSQLKVSYESRGPEPDDALMPEQYEKFRINP